MSLKKNIFANYASQIFVTLIGIVMVPMYVRYMGAEAYGLVGFFAMLQAWFNLLDMGLSPSVARETSRFRGGATDSYFYCSLLRVLQLIFFAVAILGGVAMFSAAGWIAESWLNVKTLPLPQVRQSIQLMAVAVALRWMSGLYRGCIAGSERLVWLSSYNTLVASLRFLGVLLILKWIDNSPVAFFSYQLGVSSLELMGLAVKARQLKPPLLPGQTLAWSPTLLFKPIAPVLKFSLSIAFTSSVWVLVTQTDKLILSKLIPLADYGYFSMAVLVAGGVMIISGPISGALLPRMAKLHAQDDERGLIRLYRQATQGVAVIAFPACLVLAFFSEQVLWAWTGDAVVATKAAPVLALYAVGNGFLAVSAFPYYLQYAKGDLKLHLIGNALFIVLLIPSLVWATWRFGVIGAGWAWLAANLAYFALWVPLVHRRFAHGIHWAWAIHDVGRIGVPAVLMATLLSMLVTWPANRITVSLILVGIGIILLCSAALGSKHIGDRLLRYFYHAVS